MRKTYWAIGAGILVVGALFIGSGDKAVPAGQNPPASQTFAPEPSVAPTFQESPSTTPQFASTEPIAPAIPGETVHVPKANAKNHHSGHVCHSGERDGDGDGWCGEK